VARIEPIIGMRVAATPAALDAARWPPDAIVLRLAPDEVFAIGAGEVAIADPDAIVARDGGVVGTWIEEPDSVLSHLVEWPLPVDRPVLVSGAIAGLGARIWLDHDRALILVPAPFAAELAERLP
jgi:hypothetical protein